jgi:methylmalonyl-CoA mutase
VDGDYFLSIAKLRAARAIWDRVTSACGVQLPARIEARSSRRMLAGLDAWTNLLRLTSADFAAAAGGADAVVLDAFTEPLGGASELARRQARNIQLVLREESHIGKVADPAAGSWYVESLSRELAGQGWAVLQAIEAQGGAAAALTSGFIAANVEGPRGAAMAASAHAHPGQVGVSRFPDLAGREPETAQAAKASRARDAGRLPGEDSACPPLQPMRLSEPYEALRRRAGTLKPQAQVVTLGGAREAAARVSFARNLLASGGVATTTGALDGYDAETSPVAVVAGSDEAIEAEGVETVRRLREAGARMVLVSGREQAHWAQAGADGFLHAKMDAAVLLGGVLDRLEAGS